MRATAKRRCRRINPGRQGAPGRDATSMHRAILLERRLDRHGGRSAHPETTSGFDPDLSDSYRIITTIVGRSLLGRRATMKTATPTISDMR